MYLSQGHKIKLISTVLLFAISIVLFSLIRSINYAISPAQPNEETHESHTSEDKSQLHIDGEEQLTKEYGPSISNSIAAQLYRTHYERTNKLEREAKLTKLNKKSASTSRITLTFIPSGDTISASIKINNKTTNDFDITIEGARDE